MSMPAKRFSLSRLLAPSPAPIAPAAMPIESVPAVPIEPSDPPIDAVAPPAPKKAHALRTDLLPQEDRHPKKKRSYTVDMKLCEELELLAWYMDRSSSSVVEDLVRKHLSQNRTLLEKAREVKRGRS